jgi:CRP-like cAMP-binding protein
MNNECSCEKCELKNLFFENVEENEITRLCNIKDETEYQVGETIIEAGSIIDDFVYLKSGLVKLFRTLDDGTEQIITFAKPFDFVSFLSVFSDTHYNYSVVALEPSTICVLDFKEIKNLIRLNGKFALSILEKMSRISDKIILESLDIKQKHLKGRVAYMLLFFADYIYNIDEFELPISRKEIAEYVGMSTENVIRTLSEFRKDKIIKIYGKAIEIVNKKNLQQIADFG